VARPLAPALTLDGRLERIGEKSALEKEPRRAVRLSWLDFDPGQRAAGNRERRDQLGRPWTDAAELETALGVGDGGKVRFGNRDLDPGEPAARSTLAHGARKVDRPFRRQRRRGRRREVEGELDADRQRLAAAARAGLEAAGRRAAASADSSKRRLRRRREHARGRHLRPWRVPPSSSSTTRARAVSTGRVLRFHARPGGAGPA